MVHIMLLSLPIRVMSHEVLVTTNAQGHPELVLLLSWIRTPCALIVDTSGTESVLIGGNVRPATPQESAQYWELRTLQACQSLVDHYIGLMRSSHN